MYGGMRSLLSWHNEKPLHTKMVKFWWKQYLAAEYRRIFAEGLKVVNYPYEQGGRKEMGCLHTLWNFIGLNPHSPYTQFFSASGKKKFRIRQATESIWQNYVISE